MPREEWVKIDVDMPTDEKLFGRSLLDRHLWTCLLCLAKKLLLETGDSTIYNLDAAALNSRFNLGSAKGVANALAYFEIAKPRPMIHRAQDGAITIINLLKRQTSPKDSPEAHRERQARYMERKRHADGHGAPSSPPSSRPSSVPSRSVTADAEGEVEDRDPDRKGEGISIAGSVTNGEQKPPPESWDISLLRSVRTALGKTDLDHDWQQFVGASLRYPKARREAAAREFLDRGCAADGKGAAYLLAMIRDGAGQRRDRQATPTALDAEHVARAAAQVSPERKAQIDRMIRDGLPTAKETR